MNVPGEAPLSLPILFLNLGLGLVLSLLVAWYYLRYGQSLSNRSHFAAIIPLLSLITLLVITIVKSSLALSLGLVGALSIVRFRTAIKDPEELIFLFLAIAIGLGMGADQRIPTLAAFAIIMLYLAARAFRRTRRGNNHSLYLNLDLDEPEDQAGGQLFSRVNDLLLRHTPDLDLRRMDSQAGRLQLTYFLNMRDSRSISSLMDSVRADFPGAAVSLVEQNNLLGG